MKAWKRARSERGVETSRSCNGRSQTRHTRNDEPGLTPHKDARPEQEGREQDGPLHRPSNEPDDRDQRMSPQNIQRNLDEETPAEVVAKLQREAECWEWPENDAAKHHKEALDRVIQAAAEALKDTRENNLSRGEVIRAENELAKAVQAKNSRYRVHKAGLNAEARITSPTRLAEPTFSQLMNVRDPQIDVEQETVLNRGRSVALCMGILSYSTLSGSSHYLVDIQLSTP